MSFMHPEGGPVGDIAPTSPPPLPPPVFAPPRVATGFEAAPSNVAPGTVTWAGAPGDSRLVPGAAKDRYRSPMRLALWLQIALAASIAAHGLSVASRIRYLQFIDRLEHDPQSVKFSDIEAIDQRTTIIDAVALVLALVAVGFVIALTRRLYRNLPALSNYPRRFTDGWAVGAWFVPFLNFVRPKQIVDDIWRATSPDQPEWWPPTRPPVSNLLHVWWGALIVTGIAGRAAAGADPATDVASSRQVVQTALIVDVAAIVAAALTLVVGFRLAARDRERARSLWGDVTVTGRSLTWRVAGAATAGIIAFAAGVVAFAPETASVDASEEGILVNDLTAGECFDNPEMAADSIDDSVIIGVSIQPCDAPHDAEVIAVLQHPADDDTGFPGTDVVAAAAEEMCLDEFEPVVGAAFEESVLDLIMLTPLSDRWSIGDRTIHCVATRMNHEKLTETVIDSGL
jgi:hypothetical protein